MAYYYATTNNPTLLTRHNYRNLHFIMAWLNKDGGQPLAPAYPAPASWEGRLPALEQYFATLRKVDKNAYIDVVTMGEPPYANTPAANIPGGDAYLELYFNCFGSGEEPLPGA
jgi:hypothetical protein